MRAFSTAIIPILVLILVGYGLKRAKFLPEETWLGIEKLTYFILFPALLIRTLGNQILVGVPWHSMLVVVAGTLTIAATVLILWYRIQSSANGSVFTSIFQGGVRFNTYIALAVAQAFFGFEGLALAAVAAGFMIVFINLLCIWASCVTLRSACCGCCLKTRGRSWTHQTHCDFFGSTVWPEATDCCTTYFKCGSYRYCSWCARDRFYDADGTIGLYFGPTIGWRHRNNGFNHYFSNTASFPCYAIHSANSAGLN